MKMQYVLMTPERAARLLKKNIVNRKLSEPLVHAYANDMRANNWDQATGSAISIDADGYLRDGQHRLNAIIESNKKVYMWICYGVSADGIYDNNRPRSVSDQISISAPDLDGVYRAPNYISVIRAVIIHNDNAGMNRRKVTSKEIITFTRKHKSKLDGFFLAIDYNTVSKISIATVKLALFLAYLNGVKMGDLLAFYEVLKTGMSTEAKEFPIIAYRNYLLSATSAPSTTDEEISRCQYALKKYLSGSCTKKNVATKELTYPYIKWE